MLRGPYFDPQVNGVVAWGRRPSARRAEEYVRKHGGRLLRLEDGFVRSVSPGAGAASCSMVIDDIGIYYDATAPSLFEHLALQPLSAAEASRTDALLKAWREAGISKYNHAREPISLPVKPYVVVVDQTLNDASVRFGMADAGNFAKMLEAALDQYPDCEVIVKVHPEVALGRKLGYLSSTLAKAKHPRIHRMSEDVHVVPLLRHATAVFAVTSQVGFEALLHGCRVHTFGASFYAGWGLTEDLLPPPARRTPISLSQLAYAALVRYTRYVDPFSGAPWEVEDAIAYLALQRELRGQFPKSVHAVGFSRWKRPILKSFLQGSDVKFHRKVDSVPPGATVLRWGRGHGDPAPRDLSIVTVEDGFLRSVGLGAHLVRPLSWVFDRSGIYYDATTQSDLESLLSHAVFDAPILQRARALRESIVRAGLTKYNVGNGEWERPSAEHSVVLVSGQVETDASLRYGATGIRTNRELLLAARAIEPDAYLVYKPHPDVIAGLRGCRSKELALRELCDELVTDYPMHQLIDAVDRVHVVTSLTGFEALLRGKPVTTHGAPFYSGWGLTHDRVPVIRRKRRLSLDMLVAGALILYPRYVLGSVAGGFATAEQAVDYMLAWKAKGSIDSRIGWRKFVQPLMRHWARPARREA